MRILANVLIVARNFVVHEFPLLAASVLVAVAAVSSTPALIPAAALAAALRFVVSPAFKAAALRQVPPSVAQQIEAAVSAAIALHDSNKAATPAPEVVAPPAV